MNRRLTTALSLALMFVLVVAPAAARGPQEDDSSSIMVALSKDSSPDVSRALDDAFYAYHVFELDLGSIDHRVRTSGRLNLHLGNQIFRLELEENDLRGKDFRWVVFEGDGAGDLWAGPVTTFRGTVVGDPKSVVRLSVTPEMFTGFIFHDDEMLFIDSVADFTRDLPLAKAAQPAAGDVVVYRESDTRDFAAGTCETQAGDGFAFGHGGHQGVLKGLGLTASEPPTDAHQFRTLEVALECDGQYRARFGQTGAINRMMGIMNDVDGFIYRSELNLGINVVFAGCWPNASTDPYTSLSANTTLNQMASWWNANGDGFAPTRDVTHQFSGKNFNGSTIGIAFVGVICRNRSASVGISQDVSGSASRRRLTAHEIGHNLSANHDGGSANCNGNGPIMCPSIQGGGSSQADDFSAQSFNSIDNHIDSFGGCI